MKKFILILSFLFVTSTAWGAELLIKARGNQWMENLAKADWSAHKLTQETYDARGEKGDVVEVRKDNAVYGNLEKLPDFVIIKIPQFPDHEKLKVLLDGGVYEDVVVGEQVEKKMRKKRKFCVPVSLVDTAIANGGTLTLTKAQIAGYLRKRSLDADKKLTTNTVTLQDLEK